MRRRGFVAKAGGDPGFRFCCLGAQNQKTCRKCKFAVDKGAKLRYNNRRRRATHPGRHKGYAAVAHLVERHLAKVEVASSSLVGRSIFCGSLAQLGEHLPYKQRVSGSSPLTSTFCGPVAQLVRAPACHAGGRRFEPDPGRCVGILAVCRAVLRSKTAVTNAQIPPFPHKPLLCKSLRGPRSDIRSLYASVAQSVEQGTENPRVIGSIPIGGTTSKVQPFIGRSCKARLP